MRQAKLRLKICSMSKTFLPSGIDEFPIVGVDEIEPMFSNGFALRDANKMRPLLVNKILGAIRQCRPHHLRHNIGNYSEFGFAILERSLGLFKCCYITGDFCITNRAPFVIIQSPHDNLRMIKCAVFTYAYALFFISTVNLDRKSTRLNSSH